ncbi:hypothetical protein GLOIN_2v193871 [Rhizophagus clarus]|uniref:Uncharacterized protein n=1 Tax=Rhizophagus clarus TaxID=94130 RepID=A0A8H3M0T1_9GLOM|nr:hypothetical protein GLOIN_2v193871 [Rhizophagus clarus]
MTEISTFEYLPGICYTCQKCLRCFKLPQENPCQGNKVLLYFSYCTENLTAPKIKRFTDFTASNTVHSIPIIINRLTFGKDMSTQANFFYKNEKCPKMNRLINWNWFCFLIMTDTIKLLEDGLKIDQENGGVGTNDQENDGVGKDLKKGSSEFLQNLPEELQAVYDDLSPEANNEDKTNYLKSTLANQKKQRSKGFLRILHFLSKIAKVVTGLESEVFSIISYSTMYIIQSITIVLVLICEKGFNKKRIFYVLVPLFLSGIGVGVNHEKLILAILLFGPGVVFASWIKDLKILLS